MRHNSYDREYAKVKRKAAFKKAAQAAQQPEDPARKAEREEWLAARRAKRDAERKAEFEPPDPEAAARVEASLQAFKKQMAEKDAADEKRRAELSERMRKQSLRFNAMLMLREWRAAGVVCPWLDGEGLPKTSLSMLLTLGWKIEDRMDGPVLVPPPKPVDDRKRETEIREMGS